eukprot:70196-Amphidinium_carterae.1
MPRSERLAIHLLQQCHQDVLGIATSCAFPRLGDHLENRVRCWLEAVGLIRAHSVVIAAACKIRIATKKRNTAKAI